MLLRLRFVMASSAVLFDWGVFASSNSTCSLSSACGKLRLQLGDAVLFPDDGLYDGLSTDNWSQTAWKEPTCIISPTSTSQVAEVVKVVTAKDVPFAVRSGGHSPNAGDANIDDGVLVSLHRLDQTSYDESTGLATLEPGARWGDVYNVLDQHSVTVVGGRVLTVGVGGLLLGGGLSYLTDLYGTASDNVVEYEVVLADGNTVQANAWTHSDLFWGLKGGLNNFGIVTKFTVRTYPIHMVWGGLKLFSSAQIPDLLRAFNEYQAKLDKDLYANLNLNIAPLNDTAILTLVYLKPEPLPAAFDVFYELTPLLEQTGIMTLTQLMGAFDPGQMPRWAWYGSTFEPTSEVFAQISSVFTSSPELDELRGITGGTLVGTVQPITANVALAGRVSGGNALGLQAVNQTWFAINVAWWDEKDDAAANRIISSLHQRVVDITEAAGAALEYIFMNDANFAQPVIASYGQDNVARLQEIQHVYDPELIFRNLVPGGQKIPAWS